MSEVTVSMPAHNSGQYISAAIESVLSQEGLDLELVVVDDASTDDTVEIVAAFQDPRLRLLRSRKRRGIGHAHNRVVQETDSKFIVHVDSDDLILPGALKRMVDFMKLNPGLGQAHCYDFDVDEQGQSTREAFAQRHREFHRKRPPGMDYRKALVERGCVINHLRTYRRSVLEEMGGFNEKLQRGVDYEMALRIVDKYDIGLVPEFLYLHRQHSGATSLQGPLSQLRASFQRYLICRRLSHQGVSYLKHRRSQFLMLFLGRFLRQPVVRKLRSVSIRRFWRRSAQAVVGCGLDFLHQIYWSAQRHLSWWPASWIFSQATIPKPGQRRIAYFIWEFPVLSQTFIQREVRALQQKGLPLEIIAEHATEMDLFDQQTRSVAEQVHYIEPSYGNQLRGYVLHFLARHPFRLLNLFMYVVFHRHGEQKNLKEDLKVFGLAVFMAGLMTERRLNHIHSPWANRRAFVALVTAALMRVPYTVHARAYELYRKDARHALSEKFTRAAGIITNSQYNKEEIARYLPGDQTKKIRVIYNGIDLSYFRPARQKEASSQAVRILCVARLTEQKGLEYLLKACRVVSDTGYRVQCEIIGGPVKPMYSNYWLALKRLHRLLGLQDQVSFLGAQPFRRVMEAYREADMVVLPSLIAGDGSRDVTPNVLLEAMAMQVPVVSTRVSAIPEIIEDQVSGLLVAPRDEVALAKKIIEIVEDTELRERLTKGARERIEARFDMDRNILQFMEFFTHL